MFTVTHLSSWCTSSRRARLQSPKHTAGFAFLFHFCYNLNSWWAGLCTSVLCLWFVAAEHLGQSCSVLDNISDEILDWSWAISLNNVNSLLYQNSLWSCLFKRVTDNTNNSCLRFTTRNLVLKNLLSGSLSCTHQKKVSRSLITREGAYIFRLNSINYIS